MRPNLTASLCALLAAVVQLPGAFAETSDRVSDRSVLNLDLAESNIEEESGEYIINIDDCRDQIAENPDVTLRWVLEDDPESGDVYGLKLEEPGSSCSTATPEAEASETDCRVLVSSDSLGGKTVEETIALRDILRVSSADDCSAGIENGDYVLSFIFSNPDYDSEDNTTNRYEYDEIIFRLDTTRPGAPSNIDATAGESTIRVTWDGDDDIEYRVYYSTSPIAAGALPETLTDVNVSGAVYGSAATVTDGVSLGNTYYVGVAQVDSVGNESELSEILEVTTTEAYDFFEEYRRSGGVEEGGYCMSTRASSGLGTLGLVALGLVLSRRRRARLALAAVVVLGAAVALPADALAQSREYASPITSALELRFSGVQPAIDDEFDGDGPYERVFGDRSLVAGEVEYDRQFWRGFGSLGVGFHGGRMSRQAKALNEDGERSPDRTRFTIYPVRTSLVYRFDVLQERWNVPVVIAAKAGLDYYFWRVSTAGEVAREETADGDELRGAGGTAGWHASIGLHLLLDWFAPAMARSFDTNVGVNNSYVFAEFLTTSVDDFGGARSWDLSANSAVFGLAFEF